MAFAKLAIEFQPSYSQKPTSVAVLIDGKVIAFIEPDEFDKATAKLAEMRKFTAEQR